MKTLILQFHPDPANSKTNAAMADAVRAIPDVEVVEMQRVYPDGRLDPFTDGAVEAQRLLSADRIVLQFPVQWYSAPPLLNAWMNAVLTRMYYVLYDKEGAWLEGTPFMIAATAGNVSEAYSPRGQNLFPLAELLNPLRAMAYRCRLRWSEPFLVYRAGKLDEAELAAVAGAYAERLRAWTEETPAAIAA